MERNLSISSPSPFEPLRMAFTVRRTVTRLCAAFIFMSATLAAMSSLAGTGVGVAAGSCDPSFARNISSVAIAAGIVGYFVLISFAALLLPFALKTEAAKDRAELFDDAALSLALLVYAFVILDKSASFELFFGVAVILAAAGAYLVPRFLRGWGGSSTLFDELLRSERPRSGIGESVRVRRVSLAVSAAAAAAFFAVVGTLTSLRYLTFSSPNFDFGIWCQMFHNMAESLLPVTTCERDMLLSHFSVHLSPIYYLILPFYAVFSSPVTLQLAQAAVLASGVIPLRLLCRDRGLSAKASAVFSVVFCLAPALAGGCMYDLHENCFLTPLVLWVFYTCEHTSLASFRAASGGSSSSRRGALGYWLLPLIPSALLVLVKEDAAVYLAFAAICVFAEGISRGGMIGDTGARRAFFRRETIRAALMLVFAVGYFMFASWYLSTHGLGIMSSRYANFVLEGEGLGGIFATLLRNPASVAAEAFESGKMIFALELLLPLGLLPLAAMKPHRLLYLLPMLLINLMPDYYYQHSIYYQYVFGSLAFVVCSAIFNYADLGRITRRSLAALSLCASLLLSAALIGDRWRYLGNYIENRDDYVLMEAVLDEIPSDASLIATTFLLPHVADRAEVYEYKYTDEDADYAAVDMRYDDPEDIIYALSLEGYEYFTGDSIVSGAVDAIDESDESDESDEPSDNRLITVLRHVSVK